jgi:hypothetical protein
MPAAASWLTPPGGEEGDEGAAGAGASVRHRCCGRRLPSRANQFRLPSAPAARKEQGSGTHSSPHLRTQLEFVDGVIEGHKEMVGPRGGGVGAGKELGKGGAAAVQGRGVRAPCPGERGGAYGVRGSPGRRDGRGVAAPGCAPDTACSNAWGANLPPPPPPARPLVGAEGVEVGAPAGDVHEAVRRKRDAVDHDARPAREAKVRVAGRQRGSGDGPAAGECSGSRGARRQARAAPGTQGRRTWAPRPARARRGGARRARHPAGWTRG